MIDQAALDEVAGDLRQSLEAAGVAIVLLDGTYGTGGASSCEAASRRKLASQLRALATRIHPTATAPEQTQTPAPTAAFEETRVILRQVETALLSLGADAKASKHRTLLLGVQQELERLTDLCYPQGVAGRGGRKAG